MNRRHVRIVLGLAAAGLAIMLAACGSDDVGAAKLKVLKENASRDSVLLVMGTGPLVGTGVNALRVVNGFRHQIYLVAGKQYEVLWYREKPGAIEDKIVRETETPLVVVDNKLVGQGWKFYGDYASKMNLPNPGREKEMIDSISNAQLELGKKKP
jgi:hypothetical protein